MKVSVVISTYNGKAYIGEQLDSLDAQTRQPDEIIILDDGSVDETILLAEEFANRTSIPTSIKKNDFNLGVSQSFSKGLSLATGELVFLCDQDDFWFPNKIEVIEKLALENSDMMLFLNDAIITDGDLNPSNLSRLEQNYNLGHDASEYILGCCCAVRKPFLEACLPIPQNFYHDSWLINLANFLNLNVVSKDKLQYYRRHGSNDSQHIAHSSKKVNSISLFLHRLGKLGHLRSNWLLREKIGRAETFLQGLEDLKGTSFAEEKAVNLAISKISQELKVLRQSSDLRKFSLPARVLKILTLALSRRYIYTKRHSIFDFIGERS